MLKRIMNAKKKLKQSYIQIKLQIQMWHDTMVVRILICSLACAAAQVSPPYSPEKRQNMRLKRVSMATDLCEFLVNLLRFDTSIVAYQILYPGWFIPQTIITWFSSTRGLSSCLILQWRIWHLIYWNLRKTGWRETSNEQLLLCRT